MLGQISKLGICCSVNYKEGVTRETDNLNSMQHTFARGKLQEVLHSIRQLLIASLIIKVSTLRQVLGSTCTTQVQ